MFFPRVKIFLCPSLSLSCHGGLVTCIHANGECFSTAVAMTAVHAITSMKSARMVPLKTMCCLAKQPFSTTLLVLIYL